MQPTGRVSRAGLGAGLLGLALLAAGALADPVQVLRSLLAAYVLWAGVALGCLALLMLYHVSGGAWGAVLMRCFEAGARTLPALALAFVPVALALPVLYPWARPAAVAQSALLRHQSLYLNVPFFLARAALYFAVWTWLAFSLSRWSQARDRATEAGTVERLSERLRRFSAPGLVVFGLTATFAWIDWVMSLEPAWYSSIYPALLALGGVVGALALGIVSVALLARRAPLAGVLAPSLWQDLRGLLLAFVMMWAYFAFSQYLLIWYGNLRAEVPWYLRRLQGGWEWVAGLLVVAHFALPFVLLLSTDVRRHARRLAVVAALVLAARAVDAYWLVEPAFYGGVMRLHWLDGAALLGLSGLWLGLYAWQLGTRPLLPQHEPRLERYEEQLREQAQEAWEA